MSGARACGYSHQSQRCHSALSAHRQLLVHKQASPAVETAGPQLGKAVGEKTSKNRRRRESHGERRPGAGQGTSSSRRLTAPVQRQASRPASRPPRPFFFGPEKQDTAERAATCVLFFSFRAQLHPRRCSQSSLAQRIARMFSIFSPRPSLPVATANVARAA